MPMALVQYMSVRERVGESSLNSLTLAATIQVRYIAGERHPSLVRTSARCFAATELVLLISPGLPVLNQAKRNAESVMHVSQDEISPTYTVSKNSLTSAIFPALKSKK
jgi:hypothetical protein